jgi:prephenate dehydratase
MPAEPAAPRVGYLGPEGTFSEEALLASVGFDTVRAVPMTSIHEAVMGVQGGTVGWALVPIENSIEGAVTATLDTLASEAPDVVIAGELVRAVRQCLIARTAGPLGQITTVVSHPQASGQCARFLRQALPAARVLAASSTADAVRVVAERDDGGWAALGPRLAARVYGCVVLREGVEDRHDNQTRFVWLARTSAHGAACPPPPARATGIGAGRDKTTVLFWGPGAERPGWLVSCLNEFAARDVNLTRIESRPRRERLGRYMFFVDLEGSSHEEAVAEAIAGLAAHCQEVRVLGSYPSAD